MPWNDAVLEHPGLAPTEKLVYHLLQDLGADSPPVRARIARMLGLTERHMRRVGVKLAGIGEVDIPQPEHSSLGNPHPVPENVDNQHISRAHVDNPRTCTSAPDTQVRPRTPVSAPLTPVRTLWSSSYEEDVRTKPLREPPTPQGGAGGSDPDPEYLTRLKHLWDQIDPDCTSYPESWFGRLHQEFGAERPLSVLQRFVLAEQTVADLDYPDRYKAYFGRWCRREHEEEAALLCDAASLLPGCDAGTAWDPVPTATAEPVHAGCPYAAATGAWEPADGHVAANGEPVPVGNSHVAATQKPVPADDARIAANGDYSLPSSRATESPRVRGPRVPAPSAAAPGCASSALPARGLGAVVPGAAPRCATSPLPPGDPLAGRQPGRSYPGRPRHSPFKGWSTRWPPEAYRQSIRSAYEALRAQSASGRT